MKNRELGYQKASRKKLPKDRVWKTVSNCANYSGISVFRMPGTVYGEI